MSEDQSYHWLAHEVKRLQEENKMLRKERERIWEEASHAIQIEHQLRRLLDMLEQPVDRAAEAI